MMLRLLNALASIVVLIKGVRSLMYTLPAFNLTVNIWHWPHDRFTDPPDLVTTGNLAWGKRTASSTSNDFTFTGFGKLCPILLCPQRTDIRSQEKTGVVNDVVEVPAGTGRFYEVIYVEDLGRGFANEHRGAMISPTGGWPTPIP